MFLVRVGEESVLYTGDYNMTPDRHLGAAQVEKVRPDLLITETTYATTIRDSKRTRERDFLKRVHECVERGGKVLIPVFALGRAQELCILLDSYWQRMNLNVPIFFSAGLTEKSINYYKLFVSWTSQSVKQTHVKHNAFDFKHIKTFDRDDLDKPGPMVLFATPGMLHAGTSLEAFKHWAPNPKNLLIIPGYCVVGTVGSRLTAGFTGPVEIDNRTVVDVRCGIAHVSFSAHADSKGIMGLLKQAEPRNVMLVHGEKGKMAFLKEKISREFGIPCFDPANGQYVNVQSRRVVPIKISNALLDNAIQDRQAEVAQSSGAETDGTLEHVDKRQRIHPNRAFSDIPVSGVIVLKSGVPSQLMCSSDAAKEARIPEHRLTLSADVAMPSEQIPTVMNRYREAFNIKDVGEGEGLSFKSVRVTPSPSEPSVNIHWAYEVFLLYLLTDFLSACPHI